MKKSLILLCLIISVSSGVFAYTFNDPQVKLILSLNKINWYQRGLPDVNIIQCNAEEEGRIAWVIRSWYRSVNICDSTLKKYNIDEIGLILLHESFHYTLMYNLDGLQEEYLADDFAYKAAKESGITVDVCDVWFKVGGSFMNVIYADRFGDTSHPTLLKRYRNCREIYGF